MSHPILHRHQTDYHPFHRFRPRPPIVQERRNFVAAIRRENNASSEDFAVLWMKSKHELRDDAEVGTSPSNTPEEVSVLALTGDEDPAVGRGDCGLSLMVKIGHVRVDNGTYLDQIIDR